jgi:hypothetical protein
MAVAAAWAPAAAYDVSGWVVTNDMDLLLGEKCTVACAYGGVMFWCGLIQWQSR